MAVHMTCAGVLVCLRQGALRYYTLENNQTRSETPEVAVERDRLLQKAWVGHSQAFIIDNSTNFDLKVKVRAWSVMCVALLQGVGVCLFLFVFVFRTWTHACFLSFVHHAYLLCAFPSHTTLPVGAYPSVW